MLVLHQIFGEAMAGKAAIKKSAMVSVDEFKLAMRQVVSSVAVVTAKYKGLCNGLTATAICSVSADPPTMLVCVGGKAAANELIEQSGAFAINYLSEDQHLHARAFSSPSLNSERRFLDGNWKSMVTGAPVLQDAVASFDCLIESRISHGTHNIYIGRIVAIKSLAQSILLYRDGSFRRLQPLG